MEDKIIIFFVVLFFYLMDYIQGIQIRNLKERINELERKNNEPR